MSDRGDERVGDADRQRVIEALRAHTGAGRLTLDEFSDLAGAVFAARTRAELDAVVRDLPPGVGLEPAPAVPLRATPATPATPAVPAVPAAGAPVPAHPDRTSRRWFVAIMSGARAPGRWRAARQITALAFWGGVHMDLKGAEVEGSVVDITAWAIMGGVTIRVPPGVPVEIDGFVFMGSTGDHTRPSEPLPGAPLVRVHARGLWGGVEVRTSRDGRRSRGRDRDRQRDRGREAAAGVDQPPALPSPSVHDRLPPLPWPAPSPARRDDGRHDRRGRDRDRGRGRDRTDVPVDGASTSAAAAGPSGTLTMMVTDIAGSTHLAEELGDRRWIEVLAVHNEIVRSRVAAHGGTEVKSQGDGFLVVFSSARQAILAAVDIQQGLTTFRHEHPDLPVTVRIGLHTGEIVDVDGDVFGQNVVVAVRIADLAAPGEVMVSGLTRDLTLAGGDLTFEAGEEVELRGLSQPWRIHRVRWSPAPA